MLRGVCSGKMSAHREWMYRRIVGNELSSEFLKGVDGFIDFAVCLAEVDQLEDAEVHASFRGIAFLLLLQFLPPVHTLLRGIALFLLPQLLPSIVGLQYAEEKMGCGVKMESEGVYTLLRGTTLPLLPRLLPSKVHTPLRGTALSLLLRLLPSEDHTPLKSTSLLWSPFCLPLRPHFGSYYRPQSASYYGPHSAFYYKLNRPF
ncbi:hypothetical protein Taro_023752 [Colocasia esculenta]|uniref:Uncharacterized protein n=1 Tax=Colocasia esculenta TaxID=4460 RepID=A0A843VBQ7_COLES|nr:hypothetical protein [Colocasia esculenta]